MFYLFAGFYGCVGNSVFFGWVVCLVSLLFSCFLLFYSSAAEPVLCVVFFLEAAYNDSPAGAGVDKFTVF